MTYEYNSNVHYAL